MVRRYFGRSILLGIEVLVAADLIRTVAVDPTMAERRSSSDSSSSSGRS